jgi:ADP-ribose pyrophosphatase
MRMNYRNGHLSLQEKDIPLPHGGRLRRFPLVTHDNGVIVAPVVRQGRKVSIMLLEQWRAAMNRRIWEVPGGGLLPHETPRQAAIREVREEAGLVVDKLVRVGEVLPAPGWEVETQFHFIAECHPTLGPQELDSTENIRRRLLPAERVRAMLRERRIVDLKTKALLYDTFDYLGL